MTVILLVKLYRCGFRGVSPEWCRIPLTNIDIYLGHNLGKLEYEDIYPHSSDQLSIGLILRNHTETAARWGCGNSEDIWTVL